MNRFGYRLNQHRFKWNCLILTAAVLALASSTPLTSVTMYLYYAEEDITSWLLLLWVYVYNLTVAISPVVVQILLHYFLLSIRIRFRLLNMALRNAFEPTFANNRLLVGTSNELIDLLDCLELQHDILTGSVTLINQCYAIQVRLTIYTNIWVMSYDKMFLFVRCWRIWRLVFQMSLAVHSKFTKSWIRTMHILLLLCIWYGQFQMWC